MASPRLWRCLVWVQYAVVASATPYLMLYNAAAKCFQVDVPQQTALEIEYHAPGTSCRWLHCVAPSCSASFFLFVLNFGNSLPLMLPSLNLGSVQIWFWRGIRS
jgi:hypothetical protein